MQAVISAHDTNKYTLKEWVNLDEYKKKVKHFHIGVINLYNRTQAMWKRHVEVGGKAVMWKML